MLNISDIVSNTFVEDTECVLYNGNCMDLLKAIPDKSMKLIVTSPPYNLGKEYEKVKPLKQYVNFQSKVIKECYRVLADDGSICWEVGNYVDNSKIVPLDYLLYPIFIELGLVMRNRIVWHFEHGLHASKRFSGRYEVIMWFTKDIKNYTFNLDPVRVPAKYPNKRYFKGAKKGQLSCNPLGKNPSDLWNIPNVKSRHIEKTEHPCQFPIELVERLVLSMTNEGDWVLDPFIGVGSTAIAAMIHGRKAVGADISAKYIDIAKKRIYSAYKGELLVRPMERTVYDPNNPRKTVPPKLVCFPHFVMCDVK